MFSIKVIKYRQGIMLNICDQNLLNQRLEDDSLKVHIRPQYYGERLVDETEAESLLRSAAIVNMAGEQTVNLSLSIGVGSRNGVKRISGVPFLIVFRM